MAKIFQNIFSVKCTPNKSHRVLTILGIKMQFKRDNIHRDVENIKRAMYQYINPALAPTATGDLRLLQLADTQALSIFDKVCHKLQLDYWMDYGTLLGAERHKGFIPWDDDIDLGMSRENFEKAKQLLPQELEKYGFIVNIGRNYYHPIIRILYKDSAVQLGIFPYDYIKINKDNIEKLRSTVDKFHKEFSNKYVNDIKDGIQKFDISMLQPYYKKLEDLHDENGIEVYYRGIESVMEYPQVIPANIIFPTTKQIYENLYLNAPKDSDKYLQIIYGDYLKMPPLDSTQHSDIMSRLNNMSDIFLELKDINEKINI